MLVRSLYVKVLAVLLLLSVTLIVQFFLAKGGFETLYNDEQAIALSYEEVSLVYELERDVIDLQRNLLIYKEAASETSSARFYSLMSSVESKLTVFLDMSKSDGNRLAKETIHRMAQHLVDYRENFGGVISGKKKHEKIIKDIEGVTGKIKKINETNLKHSEFLEVQYYIEKSKNIMRKYLNTPDSDYIQQFKDNISHTISLLKTKSNKNKESIKLVKSYKKSFLKLTHITRGYVFLVNVVMAGSANEFLYLGREIRKTVTKNQLKLTTEARINSQNIQRNYKYSSGALFAMVMMMAWFLIKRILLPIKGITDVFRVLSRGGGGESNP